MMKRKINVWDYAGKILEETGKGILLTTACGDKVNSMTIGWGTLGIEWGKPIFTVFVRESRFTKQMLEENGEFTVNVPFEYTQKTSVERELIEKSLIFFSKEIKVFKKGGNEGAGCDTIECVSAVRYFNGDRLPIGIKSVYRIACLEETLRYTDEEAMNIAYYRLSRLIGAELSEGQILSKQIICEMTDDEYVLHCTVTAVENIALMQEFDYVTEDN